MSLFPGKKSQSPEGIPLQQIPEKFVVRRNRSMLAMGLVLVFVFGGVSAQNILTKGLAQSRETLIAGVFCVLAGIAVLLDYKNHRLEVDGETLRYANLFGQAVQFQVSDIATVRQDISENPKLLSEEGRLLARFDRSMENFQVMIAYLKAHHVTADL
ncbi:hypothetical protein [Oscillibacter sp.]|uniref:hypothetical protein n=1 Tax=Oscillibacter sp. TaxID=1945593 RepID=UPI00262981C2|nr:hypothetical protein [Oscillibacter sp.]MDD3346933.1 hypothetical protein [Oscillibacter sp.]